MTPSEAQTSIKSVNTEISSLTPSSLVTLFEIDLSNILFNSALIPEEQKTFRFHNNIKLKTNYIIWQGKKYIAAPISAEGFELSTKGVLATPKLSITVDPTGVETLSLLKSKLREFGDLTGAKVTRMRTFAKYLDAINFVGSETPTGFAPDPNAELPRDVYLIDRKSLEDKTMIEFELSSVFDVDGITLPNRPVLQDRCPFFYRGAGCFYEYDNPNNTSQQRRTYIHEDGLLPQSAPSVANEKDELIFGQIIPASSGITQANDRGQWNPSLTYVIGDQVFIEKNGIKYYFVAKVNVPLNVAPPSIFYWTQDSCSRLLRGCSARWGNNGSVIVGNSGLTKGFLPFGGFAAVNKVG